MTKAFQLDDVLLGLPKRGRTTAHSVVVLWIMYMSMYNASIAVVGQDSTGAPSEGGVTSSQQQQGSALVPAFFVFGDSLVDDGNNNYIPSLARSNFYPYGIDFPLGATGRFCNGRTVVDLLGTTFILPGHSM